MRQLVIFATALTLIANSASALSCLPPNKAREFNWAVDSDKRYRVAIGHLKPTEEIKVPPKAANDVGVPYSVKAQFSGSFLGLSGLTAPSAFPVRVDITCAAHWCGSFPQGGSEQIMFMEVLEDGHAISFGPCGGFQPEGDLKKNVTVLKRCLRRGKCSDVQIKSLDRRP